MNNLVVPNWNNFKYQNQVVEEREESNRSSHVLMDNNEVAELTWENGQLAIHGLSGLLPNKPTWGRASDTLESIVRQGTSSYNNQNNNNQEQLLPHHHDHYRFDPAHTSSTISFSTENLPEFTYGESRPDNKRMRLEPDMCTGNYENSFQEERGSACGGGSALFSREHDATTLMTWTSLEEDPPSLKTKTKDDDSACHDGSETRDQDEQQETKGESNRSKSTRPNRAAANHNQSERRRRDRINQKMKALQRLVPNASKSDKASMLDEVIEYLKQLQAQVKIMNSRALPQMMMPAAFEMQQQMQMSLLARMGMGVGLGMGPATQSLPHVINPTQIGAVSASQFFGQPFMMPQMMTNHTRNATVINNSAPTNNPYFPYLAQPAMNMDLYNKMATIYQQQLNQTQTNQPTINPLSHDNVQRR